MHKNRFSSYQYVKDRFRRIVPFRVANNRAFFYVSRGQVNDQCLRRNVLARRNSFTRVWLAFLAFTPKVKPLSRLYFSCLSHGEVPIRFQSGSNEVPITMGGTLRAIYWFSYNSYLLISCITKTFVYDALILLPTHTSAYARALKCCTTHQPHRKSMQSKQ